MHIILKSGWFPLRYVMCKAISCGSAWWSGWVNVCGGPQVPHQDLEADCTLYLGQAKVNGQRGAHPFGWEIISTLQVKVLIYFSQHDGISQDFCITINMHTVTIYCMHALVLDLSKQYSLQEVMAHYQFYGQFFFCQHLNILLHKDIYSMCSGIITFVQMNST